MYLENERQRIERTAELLREILKDGEPIFYWTVKQQIKGPRIGKSTIKAARQKAGVISVNIDGAAYWQIPKKKQRGLRSC